MNRLLALALLLAGCASGGAPGVPSDGTPGVADARADARADAPPIVVSDGRTAHDGPLADARPDARAIDAAVDARPVDARPVDARPVDARMIDAPPPPPPDACVPQVTQLLANPSFDLTPAGTGWTENQPNGFEMIGAFANPEQSAPFNAYLGGELNFPNTITDILSQDVTIPAGTTKLEFTGFYAVDVQGFPFDDSSDLALVQTNGSPIEDIERLSENTKPLDQWTPVDHVFANPASLSGKTVRLRMTSTDVEDDDDGAGDVDQTNFLYDTFSLVATHGCP